MEDLQLSDTLQRYFSDVFLCCDEEKSGKASVNRTVELIKSGNVPEDVIAQISEICWSASATHLTQRQFFGALKLVAAQQAGVAVRPDLLTACVELPLPRFAWGPPGAPAGDRADGADSPGSSCDLIELRNDIDGYRRAGAGAGAAAATGTGAAAGGQRGCAGGGSSSGTDSEVDSDTLSAANGASPTASSAASDSPTPTNSVQERSWAAAGAWRGLVSEEQRQLLGTEEESSDRHSSDDDEDVAVGGHGHGQGQGRGDGDEYADPSSEVWTITTEQREYYGNQFRALQPEAGALLGGAAARAFFEKSRLPVHELRRIWQLADVTRDGALSLHEFNTAMHLVVLRRNRIALPDRLPPALVPPPQQATASGAAAGATEPPAQAPPPQRPGLVDGHTPPASPDTEPMLSPQTKDTAKEWTKFVDSPTSSISSPGPKPVNFDFQKVTLDNKDPKILQPVPLRLTPEHPAPYPAVAAAASTAAGGRSEDLPDCPGLGGVEGPSPKRGGAEQGTAAGACALPSAIQRPQAKRPGLPGPPGALPPPPAAAAQGGADEAGPASLPPALPPPKKEKPPPPPPRPFRSHGRSSSLDLNRLAKLGAPPSVPPRVSPNIQQPSRKLVNQRSEGDCVYTSEIETPFANFDQFEKYENVDDGVFPGDLYEAERKKLFARFSSPETNEELPRKHGAFEVYRKPPKNQDNLTSSEDKARWELFRKLQDENAALLRICQELSEELAEVRQEKLTLKVMLEKQMNGG